jgi:hypothetical protein
MPLSRHKVGNEYALGGRDLYRVADQLDPEAILDGVAMAGLVGVLRQLGDLAEYVHPLPPPPLSLLLLVWNMIVVLSQFFELPPLVAREYLLRFPDEWVLSRWRLACIRSCCVTVYRSIVKYLDLFRSRSPNVFVTTNRLLGRRNPFRFDER